MQGAEILDATLKTDLSQLLSAIEGDAEYQPAVFSFTAPNGEAFTINLKVKQRGKFRRTACDFPPIMLNFSAKELTRMGLADYDKYKLVTHCSEDLPVGNEKVLREYLAYKLYQELTPQSYRVQLVRIQYLDSSHRISGFTRYGIIIEDTDEMASRIGGKECDDCFYALNGMLHHSSVNLHAMFQYMIGNSDYSLPVLRNVKLVRSQRNNLLIPVGYDFDFSGLVEAPYAIPASHLGQFVVRQRIYLGTFTPDEDMKQVVNLFFNKQDRILRLIQQFKPLPARQRAEVKDYILSFYEQMEMLRRKDFQDAYRLIRQEHPNAIPDGGQKQDYVIRASKGK